MKNRIAKFYEASKSDDAERPRSFRYDGVVGVSLGAQNNEQRNLPCCPACGGKSTAVVGSGSDHFQVVCRSCGVSGPVRRDRFQAIVAWQHLPESILKTGSGEGWDERLSEGSSQVNPGIWSWGQFLVVLAVIAACWLCLILLLFI